MPIQNLLGSCLESQSLSGLYAVTELTARIISHPRISLLRQFPPHIAYDRRIRGYKAMTFVVQTQSSMGANPREDHFAFNVNLK